MLECPTGTLKLNNSKGENVSSANWNFTFKDNSLTENEPGITVDLFKVVLTIEKKEVDTKLPKLIGIGSNDVKYVVTDNAGNSASCSFTVEVTGKWRLHVNYYPRDLACRFFYRTKQRDRERRPEARQTDQFERDCHSQIGLTSHTRRCTIARTNTQTTYP